MPHAEGLEPGAGVPGIPYSPAIISGDHAFNARQVGYRPDGRLVAAGIVETRQAFTNLSKCLEAAGCSLAGVVSVTVFLPDLANFDDYNDGYRSTFTEPYPARATVQAGLVGGSLVEIQAVARRPG